MSTYQKPEFGYSPKNSLPHYDKDFLEASIPHCSVTQFDAVTTTIEHLNTNLLEQQLILAEYMSHGQGTCSKRWDTFYRRQILMSYGPCFQEYEKNFQLMIEQCYRHILKILMQ